MHTIVGNFSIQSSGSALNHVCMAVRLWVCCAMTRISKFVLLLLCAIGLSACFTDRWSWNQKLIVEVETPSGPLSGSAIVKVSWSDVNSVGNYPGSYRGEATVVDLGDGRYLFALLGEGTRYLALRTFNGNPGVGRKSFTAVEKVRGSKTVAHKDYPLLVTFDDINVPKTVKKVDPDNLVASFGPGYSLKSITLEITDDPVTTGKMEQILGWLGPHPEPALGSKTDGKPTPFYRRVYHGSFIRR